MSWDGYIDSILGGAKGHADKACIIGLNGGPWTTAAHASNINLQGAEAQTIAGAMNSGDFTTFQANGIHVGGEKYRFLRGDAEEGLVLGKLKENGAITIQKSDTAVVIAHTAEGKQQGDTNTGVQTIVTYLKGMGM